MKKPIVALGCLLLLLTFSSAAYAQIGLGPVVFGDFGLQCVQGGWISAQTLEARLVASAAQRLALSVSVLPWTPGNATSPAQGC